MPSRTFALVKSGVAAVAVACVLVSTVVVAGASSSSLIKEKKHLLHLSAMPTGWKIEPGSTFGSGSSNNLPGAKQLAGCIGVPSALIDSNPPSENSPYYENKDGMLEVQDTVNVFPSIGNAHAEYAAIANGKTPSCMDTLVNTPSFKSQMEAAAGASIGAVTVTKRSHLPKNTAGFTMAFSVTAQGKTVEFNSTAVYFVKGKLGQQISFNSYNSTFPTSEINHLTTVAKQLT
jgi:hypothetical protein